MHSQVYTFKLIYIGAVDFFAVEATNRQSALGLVQLAFIYCHRTKMQIQQNKKCNYSSQREIKPR